ncbi:anti-sigma factor domain-containing protein [Cohnella soli]|uniref:Anti-sigma factor domain-containing protein n=1 Tax=Cohnella soli TaxID=425005 RepID=A0ABW0HNP6_9BACL
MNRGTVMALEKRIAVLLTPDGRFVRVKRQPIHEVGEETIVDDIGARSAERIRKRLLQAGACAMAVLMIVFGFFLYRTPPVVAYVSMDINPSIELGLDAKQHVRELRAVNEDARAIVKGVRFKGRTLEEVMDELADHLTEGHYLSADDSNVVIVSIPVRSPGAQWEDAVTGTVSRILNKAASEGASDVTPQVTTTFTVPKQIRDDANANGISSGQMAFWLISKQEGHHVTLDAIKANSLKVIASEWGGLKQVIGGYENKHLIVDDHGELRPKSDDDDKNKGDKNKEDKNKDDKNKGDKKHDKTDKETNPKGENGKKSEDGSKNNGNMKGDGKKNNDKNRDKQSNDDKKNKDNDRDGKKKDNKDNKDKDEHRNSDRQGNDDHGKDKNDDDRHDGGNRDKNRNDNNNRDNNGHNRDDHRNERDDRD